MANTMPNIDKLSKEVVTIIFAKMSVGAVISFSNGYKEDYPHTPKNGKVQLTTFSF